MAKRLSGGSVCGRTDGAEDAALQTLKSREQTGDRLGTLGSGAAASGPSGWRVEGRRGLPWSSQAAEEGGFGVPRSPSRGPGGWGLTPSPFLRTNTSGCCPDLRLSPAYCHLAPGGVQSSPGAGATARATWDTQSRLHWSFRLTGKQTDDSDDGMGPSQPQMQA